MKVSLEIYLMESAVRVNKFGKLEELPVLQHYRRDSGCGVQHKFIKEIDVNVSEEMFDSLSRDQRKMLAFESFNKCMYQVDLKKTEETTDES